MLRGAFFLLAFIVFGPSTLQAALINPFSKIDPSFNFFTIETEHFKVHYHEGLEDIAKKTAAVAEEAHCVLSPAFGWTPTGKTHIALIDNTDFANGLASVVPYNFIYIYPVPPMPDMSIGKYDDWLRMLVFHEYTHILTMDSVRGYSKAMRKVFGKTYPGYDPLSTALFLLTAPPNIFLPYWWIEGVPTWAETEYTPGGRGQSSYYEMFFRMAVAEENILTVDKINGDIPYWPGGSVPYIYGLALDRYIAKEYGPDAPGKLSLAHSGRLPFLINRPPEDLTDMDYESLYFKTIEDLWEDQRAKLELLSAAPLTPFSVLPVEGEMLTNPRYSPRYSRNGKKMLAINRRDPHGHEGVVVYEGTKELLSVRRLPSDRNISWAPDGSGFYFTQAELQGGYNLYQDVYFYDIEAGKTRRVTKDSRLKDPDMSPDGKTLAIVIMERGGQNLAVLDTEMRKLTDFAGLRLSGPRWSQDGRRIVFSARDNAGKTAIYVYSLDAGSPDNIDKLLENESDNIFPAWSPDGDFIIYSSDTTGVYNLFAFSLDERKAYQVTHLLGGAFGPDISPDGKRIAFSSYDSRGFKIAEMAYDPTAFKEDFGPSIKPYWPDGGSDGCAESRIAELTETSPAGPVKYSAFGTLLPRFWLPTLNVYDEESVLGFFTGGRDVLGYHTYSVNGGIGLNSGKGYYDLRYIYDRYYPTLELRGYKRPDNSFDETGFVSSLTFPLRRLESNYRLRLGLHIKEEVLRENNVFAALLFSNALLYPYSISPEEGRTVSLSVIDYSERWGGDLDYREYVAAYGEYFGLGGHNVLFSELRAGASGAASFELGGFDEGLGDFPLRGYPEISGFKYAATLSLEYRFPLEYILSGSGTSPLFFDRFHMAVFADAGAAWNKELRSEDIKVGAGAETRLDLVAGYKLHVTPALGIASGLSRGGEDRIYIRVYVEGI